MLHCLKTATRAVFVCSVLIAGAFTELCVAEDDEQKLMTSTNFIQAYEKALASQNWDEVEPLIHADCTVTFSNGSLHRGKEEVEKAFRKNFELIEDERYAVSTVHWIVRTDEFAVYAFVYHWSGKIAGKEAAGSGRGTSSLVREGGRWLLTSEHLGPKPQD